ncbi:hypothetical protein EQ836_23305 [Ectopseudomonas mendocina]|uniref:Lipoprotein n=1 Tax=Ectopseudomonas mendocina TaxID=300 RepID=A0ABD7RNX5_ECTME|nr:hypothetical protein [Pseudomonas mendocina]TRO10082.1 hypothetical protein EQ829_23105 [Pseudomonas mendocina]TRO12150.1 hypothetical protein EQ836_23305 [Pseudomonas mendocina]
MSMLNRSFVAAVCIAFLVGCGEKESPEARAVSPKAERQVSETAIYFQDGVGVDFGVKPTKDSIRESSEGKRSRVLVYEFAQQTPKDIDRAFYKILRAEGYRRKEVASEKFDLNVQYRKKDSQTIRVRYKVRIREGFDKKTVLTIQWRMAE